MYLVLSLTLLIFPGYIDAANPEEGIVGATKAAPASPERIFIGLDPWMGFAAFVVAEEKGFFKDEGLNFKVVVFSDVPSGHNAFKAGNIQFCMGDIVDFALQAAEGYRVTIVANLSWDIGEYQVIIKDTFNDLTELRGKRVACVRWEL